MVPLVPMELQVIRGSLVIRDETEHKDFRETREMPVGLDSRDLLVLLDNQVPLVVRDHPV